MAPLLENVLAEDAVADSLVEPLGHISVSTPEMPSSNLGTIEQLFERTEAANTRGENGLYPDQYPQESAGAEDQAQGELETETDERPSAQEAVQELQDDLRAQESEELAEWAYQRTKQGEPTTADALIEKHELLGDPEHQEALASGFAEVFGGSSEEINAPALESLTAKTGLDMALYYQEAAGNPERARPLGLEALSAIGNNFKAGLMESFNMDSRLAQSDPTSDAYVGDWLVNRAWGIIDSYSKNGYVFDMAQVNTSRAAAIQGFGEFLAVSGVPEQDIYAIIASNPSLPLKAADWFARSILAPVDRLNKSVQQEQRQPARSRQTVAADPDDPMERFTQSRGKKVPGMETNSDLFDLEAVELWQHNHQRL